MQHGGGRLFRLRRKPQAVGGILPLQPEVLIFNDIIILQVLLNQQGLDHQKEQSANFRLDKELC